MRPNRKGVVIRGAHTKSPILRCFAAKNGSYFTLACQISVAEHDVSVVDLTVNLAGMPSVDYAAHTIVNHLSDYGNIRFEMGYACAIATVLFVMMVLVNKFVTMFIRRIGK